MAKFELIKMPGSPFSSRWSIQQVIPGERPIPIPYFGRRADAEVELRRLNAGGKIGEHAAPTVPFRKRRDAS